MCEISAFRAAATKASIGHGGGTVRASHATTPSDWDLKHVNEDDYRSSNFIFTTWQFLPDEDFGTSVAANALQVWLQVLSQVLLALEGCWCRKWNGFRAGFHVE